MNHCVRVECQLKLINMECGVICGQNVRTILECDCDREGAADASSVYWLAQSDGFSSVLSPFFGDSASSLGSFLEAVLPKPLKYKISKGKLYL